MQTLSAGDVLYFDGSHYTFPGNDVVHLFFNVLEHLQAGVLIHIHDIFWPDDYPSKFIEHLWSEQYLLGAWLLGGSKGLQVLFPGCYMSRNPAFQKVVTDVSQHFELTYPGRETPAKFGSSFWLRKV